MFIKGFRNYLILRRCIDTSKTLSLMSKCIKPALLKFRKRLFSNQKPENKTAIEYENSFPMPFARKKLDSRLYKSSHENHY